MHDTANHPAERDLDPASSASSAKGSKTDAPGERARHAMQLPMAAWVEIARRVWTMWGFHNLSLLGAGVAFFTFLAIAPLIAATIMIYGLVGNVDTVRDQMREIVAIVPPDAARLIEGQLLNAVSTSGSVTGFALMVALIFAIYGGMRAVSGMIGALNIINEERETRGIISLTIRAALLTVSTIIVAIVGLASAGLFAWLQNQADDILGPTTTLLVKGLTWGLAISLGSVGFAIVMRYGPDRNPAQWRWLIPGAILATFLWIAVSFGFSYYVAYISDYSATYGSLSAIAVFLMWLFFSAYGMLAGALVNAEIERQVIIDTTAGPEQPMGQRGAVLADLVEGGLSMEDWFQKTERRAMKRHIRKTRIKALFGR